MNNKAVSISILFFLILLLLAKHLKYHYFLVIFLSLLLIYLIQFKLITYLNNEKFDANNCATEINMLNIYEKIKNKLSELN
jgi:hypothetical protein